MQCAGFLSRSFPRFIARRRFLTEAFECSEVWNSRLMNPVIAKIDPEAMYYELNGIFNRSRKMNFIDFDLFVNAQTNQKFLTEVEELVHKFRLTGDTGATLPTTHHAIVRLFIDSPKIEDFVRILHDRVNYGIFPDNYCMIYLLNKLLKRRDYQNAAKIASLKMFQEDFSDNLVKYMSMYSVLKYLSTNYSTTEPWSELSKFDLEENEDEPIMVKVRVLRNPFFDDHFDLIDGSQICGKMLTMISAEMSGKVATNAELIGLALRENWGQLINVFGEMIENSYQMYEDSWILVGNIVDKKIMDNEQVRTVLRFLETFEKDRLIQGNMTDYVCKLVVHEVAQTENSRITAQKELYKKWDVLRQEKLEAYLVEMTRERRLQEVEQMKLELKHRGELLYFFDKEDEIEKTIEEKETLRKKREYIEKVEITEDHYIPPEAYPKQTL